MMLNAFIVGDRVVLEGAQRDDDEAGDKDNGGEIIGVEARDPDVGLLQDDIRDVGLPRGEAFSALPGMRSSVNFASTTVSVISLQAVCKSRAR